MRLSLIHIFNEDRAAAEEAFEDTAEEETFKETEETAAEEE